VKKYGDPQSLQKATRFGGMLTVIAEMLPLRRLLVCWPIEDSETTWGKLVDSYTLPRQAVKKKVDNPRKFWCTIG